MLADLCKSVFIFKLNTYMVTFIKIERFIIIHLEVSITHYFYLILSKEICFFPTLVLKRQSTESILI